MKILFDARHIKNAYSGLARYTFSILNTLMESNLYSKLEVIFDKNQNYDNNPLFLKLKEKEKKNNNIYFTYLNAPLFKFKHHIVVSNYVNKSDCDMFFYPHFDLPIFINKKSIFVVHDLLPLVIENYILKYKLIKQQYFKNIIKINLNKPNTYCIAVSNSTKNDIIKLISNKSNKIKVVYEGIFEETLLNSSNSSIRKSIYEIIQKRYLSYIGDRRPHKNLKEMIDIFILLKEKYNYPGYFVIAGSEKNFNINIDKYIQGKNYIKLIGKVSDVELIELYKHMDALFFLSRYEGFGLPIIEAAKFNKKIITSNISACAEIAPPNALKIDLDIKIEEKAKLIYDYLNNKDKVIDNKDYLKKFTWSRAVREIFNLKE